MSTRAIAQAPSPSRGVFSILSVVMQTKIIPMVGNPAAVAPVCKAWSNVSDSAYHEFLNNYRKTGYFKTEGIFGFSIPVTIPQNIPLSQCREKVQAIFKAIKDLLLSDPSIVRDAEAQLSSPRPSLVEYLLFPPPHMAIQEGIDEYVPGIPIRASSSFREIHDAVSGELASLEAQIAATGITEDRVNPEVFAADDQNAKAYMKLLERKCLLEQKIYIANVEFRGLSIKTNLRKLLFFPPRPQVANLPLQPPVVNRPPSSLCQKLQKAIFSKSALHVAATVALSAFGGYLVNWKIATAVGSLYLGKRFLTGR